MPENLTKEQLIKDLIKLRQRVNELQEMKEDNQKHLEEIIKAKAMFEGLFEFAQDAIVVVDHKGSIVQSNQQAERLFGYTSEELLGADHDMLVPERFKEKHLENRSKYISGPYTRQMGTGELYGRRKDGSEFPAAIALGPLRMGKDIAILAVVRDFTERNKWGKKIRELNRDVQRRAQELERAHKEMESFSYSISHDLRAPLRIIDGLLDIVLKDYYDKLDDEGKNLLKLIQGNAKRMDQLVLALLDLSKIGRQEMTIDAIDMEKAASIIAADLKAAAPERNIAMTVKELPPAHGDLALLRRALTNLLSNAIKFTENMDVAVIEVGGRRGDNENVYYVKDNGAGFNMEYADKLFKVFQRLHTLKEFEGVGVGLSVVDCIIKRHGGRAWAEAKPGEGQYFTLRCRRTKRFKPSA